MRSAAKTFLAFAYILAFALPGAAHSYSDEEQAFFSYERFYLNSAALLSLSKQAELKNDIRAFMRNFSEGIYAVSGGDLKKAVPKLLKARAIWPEYFGPDFILARINEDGGNYGLAARFYKSYLGKLKAISENKYRISESLIRAITPYGIENYARAQDLIRERVNGYGIDLTAVRPIYAVPGLLKFFILIVLLGSGYAALRRWAIPNIRRTQNMLHPPPGMWVCTKCGTNNLNIRKECETCREKR